MSRHVRRHQNQRRNLMDSTKLQQLADALTDAIGTQSRTYRARVVTAPNTKGIATAHSEIFGTVQVEARTLEEIKVGDLIFIRRMGPEKNARFIYAGYSGGMGGETPGLTRTFPLNVPDPVDKGVSTNPQGSVAHQLDKIVSEIRRLKGTSNWTDSAPTSFSQVKTWRPPVQTRDNLPQLNNSEGDLRLVIQDSSLYFWDGEIWVGVGAGSGGGGAAGSFLNIPASEPISRGNYVRTHFVDGMLRAANARGITNQTSVGFVLDTGGIGSMTKIYGNGLNPHAKFVSEPTHEDLLRPVYLAKTPGFVTLTPPNSPGDVIQCIGVYVGVLDGEYLVNTRWTPTIRVSTEDLHQSRDIYYKYTQDIGDGASTEYEIEHNLNSTDVLVQVRKNTGNMNFITDHAMRILNANSVQLTFSGPVGQNEYRVIIVS